MTSSRKYYSSFNFWWKGKTEEMYFNFKTTVTKPYSSIVQSNLTIYLFLHSKQVIGTELKHLSRWFVILLLFSESEYKWAPNQPQKNLMF